MLQAVSTLSTSPTSFPVISETAIGNVTNQTVNARDLHAFLEVGKDFSNWIKARIDQFDFVRGQDFEVFAEMGEQVFQGVKAKKEYALTLDMAKELSMVERNARGKAARRYFIECERRLLEQRVVRVPSPFPEELIPAFSLSDAAALAAGLLMVSDYKQTIGQLRRRMQVRGMTIEDADHAVEELCGLGLAIRGDNRGSDKLRPVFDVSLIIPPAFERSRPEALPAHQPTEVVACPVAHMIDVMTDLVENHFDTSDDEGRKAVCTVIGQMEARMASMQASSARGQIMQAVLLNNMVIDMADRLMGTDLEDCALAGLVLGEGMIARLLADGARLPDRLARYYGVKQDD